MTVRFGLGLFTGQVPAGDDFSREYAETIELARLAESSGFDSVWVSEHHGSSDGYLPSLMVFLAALAAATSRVELGSGLLLAPLHDPLRLAEDAAVVDALSGGRLVLGLGLGWREEEFRMFRIPFGERRARLEDTIKILRLAWKGARFSFHGEAFDFDDVRVTPPPARPGGPPVLVGGYVTGAYRRAGTIADGYMGDAFDLDELGTAVRTMEEAAVEEGRDAAALRVALMQNAFVVDDGSDAWEIVRDGVLHQWGTYDAWDAAHDTPAHDSLEPSTDEAEARTATIAGSPDEVIEGLRVAVDRFADRSAGLDLVVRLHYPGIAFERAARAVELFAEHVIPVLAR